MLEESITIVANMFIIRQMDLSDPTTFRASKGIVELAAKLGLCRGEFDFTEAFSGDFKAPSRVDALVDMFYTGRRVWRVFDLVAPGLHLDPEIGALQYFETYPISVTPEALISPQRLMGILRDHFEGTAYDLTAGLGAGPYGSPNRWDGARGEREIHEGAWERGISIHRTIFSFVAQARTAVAAPELAGLVWFGEDSPHATCFTPLYLAQQTYSEAFMSGTMAVYDESMAWWAAQTVKRVMDLNYRAMLPVIREAQNECEERGAALVADTDAKVAALLAPKEVLLRAAVGEKKTREKVLEALAEGTTEHAAYFVTRWRALLANLFVKFKNGYDNTVILEGEISSEFNLGYPAWWLQQVGYGGWSEAMDSAQQKAMARFFATPEAKDALAALPLERATLEKITGRAHANASGSATGSSAPLAAAFALCAVASFVLGVGFNYLGRRVLALRARGSEWPGAETETGLLSVEERELPRNVAAQLARI
mmetsp:Transcript_24256/g.60352  ORF Transcript_24256/g.60352 Transcript_24256/m.60352 type:complete len:483 (+) Transcript_24256:633-2081(+)